MTLDIHTKVTLNNWGFLAQMGDWETLSKAVDIYVSQNPHKSIPSLSSGSSTTHTTSGSKIEEMVIEILKAGEIRGSQLYSKLEGYSVPSQLEALQTLVDNGRIIQTETGFKLP
jgi:hypothetical protein